LDHKPFDKHIVCESALVQAVKHWLGSVIKVDFKASVRKEVDRGDKQLLYCKMTFLKCFKLRPSLIMYIFLPSLYCTFPLSLMANWITTNN